MIQSETMPSLTLWAGAVNYRGNNYYWGGSPLHCAGLGSVHKLCDHDHWAAGGGSVKISTFGRANERHRGEYSKISQIAEF